MFITIKTAYFSPISFTVCTHKVSNPARRREWNSRVCVLCVFTRLRFESLVFVCGVAQVSLPLSVCRLESRNNVVLYD